MLGEQSYKYLTVDEMKSLGDDSVAIDVTHDERQMRQEQINQQKQVSTPPKKLREMKKPDRTFSWGGGGWGGKNQTKPIFPASPQNGVRICMRVLVGLAILHIENAGKVTSQLGYQQA